MKMAKRIVTLLLVCIFAISMFAGCGQTQDPGTQASTAAPAATAAEATAAAATTAEPAAPAEVGPVTLPLTAEKSELSLWYPFPPFFSQWFKSPDDAMFWQELEKRTNVHIKFVVISTETARETFSLMAASNEFPDMIQGAVGLYQGGADKAVADGVLLKLNDLIDKSAPHFKKILDSDPVYKKKVSTDTGNIVEFNQLVKNSDQSTNAGPMVRQDWMEELNIATPVTYDDYYNMLKAFKEKKGAEAPLFLYRTGIPSNDYLVQGFGVAGQLDQTNMAIMPFYQVDGKVKYGHIEPGFKDYIALMNKWYSEGLVYKDFYSYKDSTMPKDDYVTTGKSGLWYFDNNFMTTYKQKATDPNFKLAGIPDAVKTPGDKLHLQFRQNEEAAGGFSIAASSKNAELAARWMDYLYSDEGAMLATWGEEGISYTMVDGKPKFTKEMTAENSNKWPPFVCFNKYTLGFGPYFQDYTRNYDGLPENELDAVKQWTSNSDNSYVISKQITLTDTEGAEFANKYSDIQTYSSEMIIKFIVGKEPLDKFDAFVEQIKKMGIEDCIKIRQAALDRFNNR